MGEKEIRARLLEIKGTLAGESACDIDALEAEVRNLQAQLTEIETRNRRTAIAAGLQDGTVEGRHIEKPKTATDKLESEKRGKDLKEHRAVTLSSNGVILPDYQASDIKPTFNQVSSLLDLVNVKNFSGGESFKQPYSTGYGEGGYTAENSTPTTADATFGYAEVTKTKITAYSEDSEEMIKLPGANYDAEVTKGISIALRKKITKEILIGDGSSGHFIGIFDDGATAIDAATDISFSEIDETTLDEIIYSYGGDENVEDLAVLVLNKSDLKAFATLRDDIGDKVYTVVNQGNKGTIDGVPYIINSNCKAISAAATTSGLYAMAYGSLSNYTMGVFSPIDVQRSVVYKFAEGMIAHRGNVFCGGNVTAKNGFLRVKKA